VNFPINPRKATEAYVQLLEEEGGRADHLRLAKLIYLADRESILRRGIPIVGGRYYSLQKGPMISEMTNFANRQNAPGWKEHVSPRYGNEIKVLKPLQEIKLLSEAEIQILSSVVNEHRKKTTEELTQWCHEHCPEYENVLWGTRRPISVESLLAAEKNSQEKIDKIIAQAKADLEMEDLIAAL
jgi:uncharacterized phage-associated protein